MLLLISDTKKCRDDGVKRDISRRREVGKSDEMLADKAIIVLLFHFLQKEHNNSHHGSPVQGVFVVMQFKFFASPSNGDVG